MRNHKSYFLHDGIYNFHLDKKKDCRFVFTYADIHTYIHTRTHYVLSNTIKSQNCQQYIKNNFKYVYICIY